LISKTNFKSIAFTGDILISIMHKPEGNNIVPRGKMFLLTDLILLSWTKAMDISAWSMMNSTAFAPASCYTIIINMTIGFDECKMKDKIRTLL